MKRSTFRQAAIRKVATLGAALLLAAPAFAHETIFGDLTLDHPHLRETPPNASTGAGYLVIENAGDAADALIGAEADFADHVEVHEMTLDDGVMKMRELDGGAVAPAGGLVTLEPGGLHLMFMGLKERLVAGEKRQVRLDFAEAGSVEVEFVVEKIEPTAGGAVNHGGHGAMNHDGMDHGSMDHDDMNHEAEHGAGDAN